jgi:hypothetical protein
MDILTIIQAVFRRWYVTLPIVLVGVASALYLNTTIPPQYESRGQVLLANPELNPAGLPSTLVDVDEAVGRLGIDELSNQLAVGDATLRATASDDATIGVTATAANAQDAEASVRAVVDWYVSEVTSVQQAAGVPEDEQLQPRLLAEEIVAQQREDDSFEASAAITLRDPTAGISNPFGASNTTARILLVAMQSDAGRLEVNARTADGVSFEVSQSSRDAAPILAVTTYGPVPDQVIAAFDDVVAVLEQELDARQDRAEVPTTRRTSIEVLAAPQTVTDTSPPIERSVAAVVGLAGLIAIATGIALESVAARRRRAEPTSFGTIGGIWPTDDQLANFSAVESERSGPDGAREDVPPASSLGGAGGSRPYEP